MTKTERKLLDRALANGGRGIVIQSWGKTPKGGTVRGSNARELKALRELIGGRWVDYARFPADPKQTHRSTFNGYTQHTVEHVYTVTDFGRACYARFSEPTA
jgi:hypothetical protein